jgi:hypothetical protein
MTTIIDTDFKKAREYFLDAKNYVNFDLPGYFSFQKVIDCAVENVTCLNLKDLIRKENVKNKKKYFYPTEFENVNYRILSNKDGNLAWRPFEIINPVLYVLLVNVITKKDNWNFVMKRFSEFKSDFISCESMPFISEDQESHRAHQVKKWWTNVEKGSIKLALRYEYVIDADIADCYGSIYTHAIPWALHDKEIAKSKKSNGDLLGNQIDSIIRAMRYGQTNGIPQGSNLMDFIAEIVLGYADKLLAEKLNETNENNEFFSIVRYRDDYKIFTNNPEFGNMILKELSIVLSSLGLKLNTQKTKLNNDPVLAAVKDDKIYELFIPDNKLSLSKKLYQIYAAALKFPNSGMIVRQMNKYFLIIENVKKIGKYDDLDLMISIVANIALRSPKTYPWTMAVLSKLIGLSSEEKRKSNIKKILYKFQRIPNTGLLDIWLQRITYETSSNYYFKEKLTEVVKGDVNLIWNYDWLDKKIADIIAGIQIVNEAKLKDTKTEISKSEVALFKNSYPIWL